MKNKTILVYLILFVYILILLPIILQIVGMNIMASVIIGILAGSSITYLTLKSAHNPNKEVVGKWDNFRSYINDKVSFIATYSILIGVIVYIFYYGFCIKLIPLLYRLDKQSLSTSEQILYILNNGQFYVEFATAATLLGLYHLLSEGRAKLKAKNLKNKTARS
ncbi:hypothetical protein [Bacillus sp. RO1]|uniref:hypothetical protein n=1 Tax=Bacillus sp. RO1 TaxID=2722703 RepID=UPI001456A7EC|nr:hypothetical protein [Bacillus sp. RO1]NLP52028.1 hypothetical protein [Bacillus sp. RO1]